MLSLTESLPARPEEKVVILAPTGQDAFLIARMLAQESITTQIISTIEAACCELEEGRVAALVLAEEALSSRGMTQLNRALEAQEPWSDVPIILMTSSGDTTLVTLQIRKAFSPVGNLNLIERPFRRITLQSVIDVALRARRKQHEVRELLERHTAAARVRDEFISIASHELKTPLTSLKLQTQINERRIASGDLTAFDPVRTRKLIESTSRQVDRLTRLVEDMLDISRINLGKFHLNIEDFDLAEMVVETAERTRPQAEAAGCEITVNVGESIIGCWDRFRVEQIVTNLLSNAIRYCPRLPIKISVTRDGPLAVVVVRDQGPGIAAENQERIFERFERAVNAEGIGGGMGLGLYICRQIAQAHGGSIRVESVLGQGSSFILSLPVNCQV
jgi:signal transduction histidine kinase